jgi:hypothetical protein
LHGDEAISEEVIGGEESLSATYRDYAERWLASLGGE